MPIIRVENLVKEFGSIKALAGVTLQVKEGEVFGIVGPDGAGKTTCMRILSSILNPTSGDAWVNGFNVLKDSEKVTTVRFKTTIKSVASGCQALILVMQCRQTAIESGSFQKGRCSKSVELCRCCVSFSTPFL